MTSPEKTRTYSIEPGEKVSAVIAYTTSIFAKGEVVTKEAIRVSVWLRTNMAPQYITMHGVQLLLLGSGGPKPQAFEELHLPTSQVIAFHLLPPAKDPLDYDPNEPNRKMEPVTALVGAFRFDGLLRMSTQTTLEKYLDVTKENFIPIYEVEITQPAVPAMGVLRVPYVLVRRDIVMFSPRAAAK